MNIENEIHDIHAMMLKSLSPEQRSGPRDGKCLLSPCLVVVSMVLLFLLHNHIRMASVIAYSYLYWLRPSVAYVPIETVGDADQLPVPKLIHQTWKDEDVPDKWKSAQKSCVDRHKGYEYRLWTDKDGLELIKTEYPWFLQTYASYPYNIQRVDALRYFILHKYGGIYIDLDIGCNSNLDFMRVANFSAPMTHPIGMSNDVMASVPGNAFLERAITRLPYWNHWVFVKYIQVMFGTGPMFLTTLYATGSSAVKDSVSVLDPAVYGKYDFSGNAAFYHLHGSSWHGDDAFFFLWIDTHKYVIIAFGLLVTVAVGIKFIIMKQCSEGDMLPVSRSFAKCT